MQRSLTSSEHAEGSIEFSYKKYYLTLMFIQRLFTDGSDMEPRVFSSFSLLQSRKIERPHPFFVDVGDRVFTPASRLKCEIFNQSQMSCCYALSEATVNTGQSDCCSCVCVNVVGLVNTHMCRDTEHEELQVMTLVVESQNESMNRASYTQHPSYLRTLVKWKCYYSWSPPPSLP